MNKNRLIISALCLALAFAMTFTPIFSSYAIIATAAGTGEEQATELENTDATNEADQDKTTSDPEVDSTKDQQTEDAKAEEKVVKEEKSDKAEKEAAKDEEKATKTEYVWKDDKVKVTATLADAEAIPDDAKLVATAIDKESQDYNYKAYMDALNKDSKIKYDESNTLLYDIAFIKDGVELQPESGKVSVTFDFLDDQLKQSIGAKKAADVNVIHLPLVDEVKDQYDTTADAKNIKAKDINVEEVTKKDNDLKVSVKNEKVVFETKDFSVFAYTVDFEYNGYAFSMPGGTTIKLSEVFAQLHIDKKVKDVENVTFSNPKLVEVKKNTFGNDWTLESKKAFSTEETLTVEMTDGTIVIKVTDAQAYSYTVSSSDSEFSLGGDYTSGAWYWLSTLTDENGVEYYCVKPVALSGTLPINGEITEYYHANDGALAQITIGSESSTPTGWTGFTTHAYQSGDIVENKLVYVAQSVTDYEKVVTGVNWIKREAFSDGDVLDKYTVSLSSTDDAASLVLDKAPEFKLKTVFKDSNKTEIEDASTLPNDYYLLIKMVKDGENYYALQKVDTASNPSGLSDPITFKKYSNGSLSDSTYYYTGSGTISTQVTTGTTDLRTAIVGGNGVVKYNENTIGGTQSSDLTKDLFSTSSAIEETGGSNVMTTTFTHRKDDGVDHDINVSLYKEHKDDISKAVLYPNENNMSTADNAYFFRVRLYNNGKLVGYKIVPVTTAEAASANETGQFTHTIKATDTFQLVDDNGVDIAGGALHYDPTVYTSDVRLYKANTAGQLPANLDEVKNKGTDELDGFDFWMNNLDQANNKTDIALYKAYKKIYQVKIEIEGGASPTSSDAIGMYDKATHQTSNPDELTIGDISSDYEGRTKVTVGGNTVITYLIEDQTTDPLTYHWSDHGGTKITGNETFTLLLKQNNKDIASGYPVTIGGEYYTVSYDTGREDGKNVVYNDNNDVTTITHFIKLTKAQYDSAIGPYDVLGEGAEYGVVADTYIRKDHTETNFAVNHYREETGAGIDLAANMDDVDGASETMPFYVGDYNKIVFTGNTTVNPDIYTPSERSETYVHNNNSDEATDKIHQNDQNSCVVTVIPTDEEDVNNYVAGLISKLTESSNTYKDKPSVKMSGRTVDTTMFPDNVTIYIDATDLNISEPGWTIKKLEGQSIVFNIPGETVNIAKEVVSVYTKNADGTLTPVIENMDSNTGGNGGNKQHNSDVENYILNHITFNAYEATKVNFTNGPAGLFLAPNADVEELSGSGTGWVATGKSFIQTSSEWHFFRTQRRYNISGEVNVEKIFGGTSWGNADTFDFSITAKGKMIDGSLVDDPATIKSIPMPLNTTISIGKNSLNNPASFGSITYNAAGIYVYEVKEVIPKDADKIPGVTYDDSVYTVKITVTPDGNNFKKTVEIQKGEGSYEAGGTAEFTNTHAEDSAEGTATLKIKKALGEGDTWPEDKSAVFKLTAVTEGAPMPEGNGDTVTLTEAGEGSFGAITYPQASAGQTYEYKISETVDFGDGWTKSGDITATVVVGSDPGEDGKLPTTVTYDPDNFTVTNDKNEESAEGTATLHIKKALGEGDTWPTGKTATFELTAVTEGAPMPEGNGGTVNLTEAGEGSFGTITYPQSSAGQTYEYKISETSDFGTGWTKSGEITATVVVGSEPDETGKLPTTVTYSPEDFTVTNDYSTEATATLKIKKALGEGDTWPEGKSAVFTLEAVTEDAPMPAEGGNTVTLTSAGEGNFGSITYPQSSAGQIYVYTISETGEFGGGWTKSGDITATVTVGSVPGEDGKLPVDIDYSPDNFTVTNDYSTEGTATLQIKKALGEGDTWPAGKSAVFTLEAVTEDAPMPAEGGDTVTLTSATTGDFGEITYPQSSAGQTYEYTISENEAFGPGWTKSRAITATVVVGEDDGSGELTTTVTYDPSDFTVTNDYSASGEGEVKVKKTLSGREWKTGDSFEFTITPVGDAPAFTPNTVTITNADEAAEYTKSFGKVEFAEAGTYQWNVVETHHGQTINGVAYDSAEHKTVTITVVDDGEGHLVAAEGSNLVQTAGFTNTYSKSGEGEIKVLKNLVGRSWATDDSFEFTITPVGDAPATEKSTATVTKDSTDYTESFGKVQFTEAGTYEWTVSETHKGQKIDGVTYDSQDKTITIKVKDDGNGGLIAETDSALIQTAEFENNYSATGEGEIKVKKTLEGREWKTGDSFKFTITPNGDAPAFTPNTVTITNVDEAAEYTKSFGKVAFTEAGTYSWTVSEEHKGETVNGVTYDREDRTVTIKVKDNGKGAFVAEEGSALVQTAAFTNTYDTSGTATLQIKKALGEGDTWPEGKSAVFTLAAKTSGAPMPEGSGNTVTLTSATTGDFGEITYPKSSAGKTYEYTISENDTFGPGWTKSGNITATVKVGEDDGSGTLSTTVTYDPSDFTVTNDYSTKGEGEVKVKKTLNGREWKTGDSFEFTITPANATTPAFTPNKVTITSADAAANYTKSFGKVEFTKAGTYQWNVVETHHGETINGVAYDTAEHKTVTITVEDDGNGHLIATEGSDLIQTVGFTNTYSKSGEGEIKVLKNLVGRNWATDDSFEFTITPVGNAPRTEKSSVTVTKASTDYTESFGKVTFAEAGTYQWTVSETHKGEKIDGVTYDSHDKTVTIKVKDDGNGGLIAETDSALVQTAEFENNYSATGEGEIKVKKTLEGRDWKTGDSFEFTLTPGGNNAGVETPMPETEGIIDAIATALTGSQKVTITSEDAADEYTKSFGTVKFTKAGTYNWTVVETHHGETINGVAYDSAESKTVTITVVDDGKGHFVAEEGKTLVQTAPFTNKYSTEGKAELKATKVIEYWGGAKSFKFKLTAGTNTAGTAGDDVDTPMPAGATDGVITKTVTKDPEVLTALFGEITYTAPGEYSYTIEEEVPSDAVDGVKDGITYDTVVHTVKVTANDDAKNGQMVMTIDYGSGYSPADTAEPLEITNTYDAKGSIELTGTKKFDHGDFADETFTFSVYKKSDFKDASSELFGFKKVDRNELGSDADLQAKKVASATTAGKTADENGKLSFTFAPKIEFTLSELDPKDKKEDGTYEYHYVVVEDIPENAVKKTVGEETFYYDSENDIKYDATVYDVTINVRDKGDGTLDVTTSDGKKEFGFENAKFYTKLKLTKDIDKLVAGDTEGELADVTFVFKVVYTDPILGSVNRNVSIKFDSNNVAAQTAEVDKIPIDANVTVTEVYAADYKCDGDPTKNATLSEELDTQTGMKFFKVEFSNKMQGLITGGGLINSMQGGSGEKDGDSYKYNYQLKNQTGDLPD